MRQSSKNTTSANDMKALFKPGNLLKTTAAGFPGTAMLTEALNQIHGERVARRLDIIEETIDDHQKILNDKPKAPKVPTNWPAAVGDYIKRMVDIVVFYNASFHKEIGKDSELFQVIGHGVIVDENKIITPSGVLKLANEVAEFKHGKVDIVIGLVRYGFDAEEVDPHSGLVMLHLGCRDEDDFRDLQRRFKDMPAEMMNLGEPIKTPIAYSLTPWIGEDICFFQECWDEDAMSFDSLSTRQLEKTSVSYFLKPIDGRFKAFVTGTLFERILHAGAPVFNCDGQLLGVISDVKTYSDRPCLRAVVSCLAPHPYFMDRTFKKGQQ